MDKKTARIALRLDPKLRRQAERLAKQEARTLSGLVQKLLWDYVQSKKGNDE